MKIIGMILAVALCTANARNQDLPAAARNALDTRFSHWHFRPAHIPSPCDTQSANPVLLTAVQKCNLNDDQTPDYAVVVTTGDDLQMMEYFLALVSNSDSFDVFVIDSARNHFGAGERLLQIVHAGDSTAFFDDEEEVARYGKLVDDNMMIVFPTDALETSPGCEAHYGRLEYDVYVFIRGRFLSFGAAD